MITPLVTSQVFDAISIRSPPSPMVRVPPVVHVAPDVMVLEPRVPPVTVRTSATSLSAHGLVVFTKSVVNVPSATSSSCVSHACTFVPITRPRSERTSPASRHVKLVPVESY